jgi:hypothetical protein
VVGRVHRLLSVVCGLSSGDRSLSRRAHRTPRTAGAAARAGCSSRGFASAPVSITISKPNAGSTQHVCAPRPLLSNYYSTNY